MLLDETMSGEAMAHRVIEKWMLGWNSFREKICCLSFPLRRLLYNVLIQPHFNYVCVAWYRNLTKKAKDKPQVSQNKYIRFCHKLNSRNIDQMYSLRSADNKSKVQTMCYLSCNKICSNKCPTYLNDVFWQAENIIINMRNSYLNLSDSFWKTSTGQSSLSYIGPAIWNTFSEFFKKT